MQAAADAAQIEMFAFIAKQRQRGSGAVNVLVFGGDDGAPQPEVKAPAFLGMERERKGKRGCTAKRQQSGTKFHKRVLSGRWGMRGPVAGKRWPRIPVEIKRGKLSRRGKGAFLSCMLRAVFFRRPLRGCGLGCGSRAGLAP